MRNSDSDHRANNKKLLRNLIECAEASRLMTLIMNIDHFDLYLPKSHAIMETHLKILIIYHYTNIELPWMLTSGKMYV